MDKALKRGAKNKKNSKRRVNLFAKEEILTTKSIEEIVGLLFETPDSTDFWVCSEYVVDILGTQAGTGIFERRMLKKVSSIFGRGMGDKESPCGLFMGAVLILGYLIGREDATRAERLRVYEKITGFKNSILERYKDWTDHKDWGGWWQNPDTMLSCKSIRTSADENTGDLQCKEFLKILLSAKEEVFNGK